MGAPLVNRATYPVQLTEAGEQFLPIALASISELVGARQAIRDTDRGDRRFTKFSVLHTISLNFLASRIEDLQLEIPDLRTRVVSDSLSTCCDLLVQEAVDILICYEHHSVSPLIDETQFEKKRLLRDRLMPVAAAEPAHEHCWDLSRLAGAPIPYLAYERTSFLGMVVENILEHQDRNFEMIYVDGLVEAIKRRILRGSGFAWMPETAISAELSDGLLVPIGGEDWNATLTISAYANPDALAPAALKLWDLL